MSSGNSAPGKPSASGSAETRLAGIVAQLVTHLRRDADDFPLQYDNLKSALWVNLAEADRFAPFGSDFFSDLLEVTRHPIAAADTDGAAVGKLRHIELFLALRKLQRGDLQSALAVMRSLAGQQGPAAAGGAAIALPAGRQEPVLTTECLQSLVAALQPSEPATAAVARQLEPLLRDDPTYTSGAAVNILIQLTALHPRLHPGYGLLMQVHSAASPLDRSMRSLVSLDGIQVAADGLTRALGAADAVSRGSGGVRLDRGLDMRFFVEGLQGTVDGHSADLAYALLFASDGRSAGSGRHLVPQPGTAAMGEVDADALILEVAVGPLHAKLRRLLESGVRRLYLPEAQAAVCHGIMQALQAEAPDSAWVPAEDDHRVRSGCLQRRVVLIPAASLEQVALPPHIVTHKRRTLDSLRRFGRRNRVRLEVVTAGLLAAVVTLVVLFGERQITDVKVRGDRITVQRGMVRRQSHRLQVEDGALRCLEPREFRWWGDADGDGKEEILVLSLHCSGSAGHTGRVRVDCLGPDLESRWHDYVDMETQYGNDPPSDALLEVSDVLPPSFADVDGDGTLDIVVACRPLVFPSPLIAWDARGHRILQYMHAGHIQDFCLVPLAFVPKQSFAAWPTRDGDDVKCVAVLATAQEDSGCALFLLPPRHGAAASPARKLDFRHATLPACDGPYVRIPPTLVALQLGTGKSNPDHVEYLVTGRPHLKVTTLEVGGSGTLIRRFDALLSQYRVEPTDEWLRLTQHTALDPAKLRESIETLHYYEKQSWITRRRSAWLQ